MRGLSITLVFGSYGGFYCSFSSWVWRFCFGWIALSIYWRTDIENFIDYIGKRPK